MMGWQFLYKSTQYQQNEYDYIEEYYCHEQLNSTVIFFQVIYLIYIDFFNKFSILS